MAAQVDLTGIITTLKSIVGVASIILITVGVVRAFGVDIPYLKMSPHDISVLAAAAAFVSRS